VKGLVSFLCAGLKLSTSDSDFEERVEGDQVTLTLSLPLEDVAKVDGRDHRTAKAIRQVLSAAAAANNRHYHLVVRAKS
jgi:predicted RNA-binding protein YlqC (UPF0109 family)